MYAGQRRQKKQDGSSERTSVDTLLHLYCCYVQRGGPHGDDAYSTIPAYLLLPERAADNLEQSTRDRWTGRKQATGLFLYIYILVCKTRRRRTKQQHYYLLRGSDRRRFALHNSPTIERQTGFQNKKKQKNTFIGCVELPSSRTTITHNKNKSKSSH